MCLSSSFNSLVARVCSMNSMCATNARSWSLSLKASRSHRREAHSKLDLHNNCCFSCTFVAFNIQCLELITQSIKFQDKKLRIPIHIRLYLCEYGETHNNWQALSLSLSLSLPPHWHARRMPYESMFFLQTSCNASKASMCRKEDTSPGSTLNGSLRLCLHVCRIHSRKDV